MIAIIDYGVGNLFSLKSSFAAIGAEAVVTDDKEVYITNHPYFIMNNVIHQTIFSSLPQLQRSFQVSQSASLFP